MSKYEIRDVVSDYGIYEDDEKKQIEAMAKDVARSIVWCSEVSPAVDCLGTAAVLYDKNYRKQSEVAREFIEACDSMLSLVCEMTGLEMTFFGEYAKLKKKYTEEKTDENISD